MSSLILSAFQLLPKACLPDISHLQSLFTGIELKECHFHFNFSNILLFGPFSIKLSGNFRSLVERTNITCGWYIHKINVVLLDLQLWLHVVQMPRQIDVQSLRQAQPSLKMMMTQLYLLALADCHFLCVNFCTTFVFQISRFMSINKLKYFFAVDTRYVLKKLMILMFPYTHQVISTTLLVRLCPTLTYRTSQNI